ncbi:hypothetical protein BH11MYX1_BH11MYX1_40790 [soil metagenome]
MGRLIKPASPCIQRFRGHVPDPYLANVKLTPTDGVIVLSFESGQQLEFNACVVAAVKTARLPAGDLDKPTVVPFAFSFAAPLPN